MSEEEKDDGVTPIQEDVQIEDSEQVFKYLAGFYDGLPTISDVNLHERAMLLRLNLLASFRTELNLDNTFLDELRDAFLKYSISKNRKGFSIKHYPIHTEVRINLDCHRYCRERFPCSCLANPECENRLISF